MDRIDMKEGPNVMRLDTLLNRPDLLRFVDRVAWRRIAQQTLPSTMVYHVEDRGPYIVIRKQRLWVNVNQKINAQLFHAAKAPSETLERLVELRIDHRVDRYIEDALNQKVLDNKPRDTVWDVFDHVSGVILSTGLGDIVNGSFSFVDGKINT